MKLAIVSGMLAVAAFAVNGTAQPVVTQTGRALDANPSIESRYNSSAQPNPYGLANQYGITGQLRLGRSFQGTIPYGSFGQFQGSLGSASLYDFERDSFSLQLLDRSRQGYSYVPPYINSTRTVFDAGRLVEPAPGQTQTILNPFARPDYRRAQVIDISPTLSASDFNSPLMSTVPLPSMPLADQLTYRRQALDAQEQMLREGLPRGLGDTLGTTVTPLEATVDPLLSGQLQPAKPKDDPLNSQPGPLQPIKPDPAGQSLVTPPVQPDQRARDQHDQPGQQAVQDRGQLPPGQDLFSDLLQRAAELKTPGQGDSSESPAPSELKSPSQVDQLLAAGSNEDDAAAKAAAAAAIKPPVNLGVEYASLASKLPTRPNSLVGQAEQLMASGRFYDAVARLLQAKAVDPSNPLIWLRASHAYFAAGEFASAAADLSRSITLFPSIVSVRTELIGLTGQSGVKLAETRLAELGRLVDSANRADLRMLLCYAQMMAGKQSAAEQTAALLLKPDSGASQQAIALAKFVLKK